MALANTGITTTVVKNALEESTNNVGGLCSSTKINHWSKWKPISLKADTLTYALLKANNFGITVITANTPSNLLTQVQGNGLGYIYNNPQGGANSPYRLGDFRYYNHGAGIPIYSHYRDGDTEKIANVSTTYSVSLDGIETIDTGDDTVETSQTAGIGKGDIYPNASSLKRGALLTDGSKTVWSVGTVPYGNGNWQQLKGKTVTCLEFLCNLADGVNYITYTANANDRFYALPHGLHSITLLNETPSGSKQAYVMGRCDLSTDRKTVSYRLGFSSVGDVYAGGTLTNVWFILSDDYNGSNQISRIKIADSLSLGNEETTSYYTGMLSSPSAMSQAYLIVMWNGIIQWRTTPTEMVNPTA